MARVTVEDCIQKVPSRFELVLLAARRARQIMAGAPVVLDEADRGRDDKYPITALREIAGGYVSPEELKEQVLQTYCRDIHMVDDEEREMTDLLLSSSEDDLDSQLESALEQELNDAAMHVASQSEVFSADLEMDDEMDSYAESDDDSDFDERS